MTSIPILQPKLVYGVRTDIKGNVNFIGDEEVLYPVGALLAINNFTQKRQRFIRLPDKGVNVTRVVVSPNQKLIAVSEKGEKPSIYLYDATTLKKKRQIQVPLDRETTGTDFVTFQFTFDARSIIAVIGDPEWNLYSFRCDRGKLESTVKANNLNGTGIVNEVACNPNDSNLIALVGYQVFKIMACSDTVWRQYGFSKSDNLNLSSAAWLSQDRLLAGSAEGKFMLFDSGDLKAIFWVGDLAILNLKEKEKDDLQQQSSQSNLSEPSAGSLHTDEDYQIRCFIVFPRGLAFAYLNGTVHLYEKDSAVKYRKRNVFKVPNWNIIRYEADESFVMNSIVALAINPSQDKLIVTCKQNQLYHVPLWGPDLTVSPELDFHKLGLSLHHGAIGALSVCAWKPIFITSGLWDRTVRVWNYETEVEELCKQFQEDVFGLALHPTGLYTVVGFSDKLRFLTIMIDDFTVTKEFPIRNCRECSFSSMGHYFAVTNANVIQVFSTTTFQNVFALKGHNGKIRGMSWTRNNHRMTSCGSEGAVYEWDIIAGKRSSETIIKSCAFSGVVTTYDGRSNYAVGSDGFIRELVNSNVHREVIVFENGLDTVALSNSDQMLFASGNEGVVYSVKLPILDNAEYLEFAGHCTTIQRMAVSYDDRYVITCSKDGVICVWKLLNTEGKAIKLDEDLALSTDILISREDLEEKLETINDLQLRMHELVTEHSYQMRNVDALHSMKVKEIHEGYCIAIEDLKDKNENLEAEHAQELSNMNVEMNNMKLAHEEFVQKLEISYNDKLIVEYEKYLQLEDKLARTRANYENQLDKLHKEKKQSEESITNDFVQKLEEKEVQVEELIEESKAKRKEHELIKQQIEDDADREIYELKAAHEKELKDEQDNNVRLRGETGIIKKKLLTSQKEIDELKHNVYSLQNEHVKFKGAIIGLEKDIADLKKEILERDDTIQDKEKRIYELKRKNQELEKFKFILEFKIKELKSQIEPRDRQIREQTEQNNAMVSELENLQKVVMNLDIQLGELREKLNAADNEMKREVTKNKTSKSALKMIRTDIHQISGYIQDIPKLTRNIKEMYHKYNADKDFEISQAEDFEAKNEFLRQRDFLERTVKTLQLQVTKHYSSGGADKTRLVDENSVLIEETNHLRKNLKEEITRTKKMESILGLSTKYMVCSRAQQRLNSAIATKEDIRNEYKQQIQEDQHLVTALQEENHRLLGKIIIEPENVSQCSVNEEQDEDSDV